jgi:hypothetical protein
MKTRKETVMAVTNDEGKLISIIHRDETTRNYVVYKVEPMDDEEIADLINNKHIDQKV